MSIENVNIPAEIERAFAEIAETDPRTDHFRSMKILMIYQCQLLERIAGFIDAFMKEEPEK